MKKVLIVSPTILNKSGVPSVIMSIVRLLHKAYVFDIVVSRDDSGYYDEEFCSYGGKIIYCTEPNYKNNRILYPFKMLTSYYKKIEDIILAGQYDIVHCQNGCRAGLFLKAAKKYDTKVRICHCHGNYFHPSKKNLFLILFEDYCIKLIKGCSTHRISCSKQAGVTLFGQSSFEVIGNPVDVDYFSGVIKKKHGDVINLLQIGYYCKNKNQIFSVSVLKEIIEMGYNANLYFLGFDLEKKYSDDLREYINTCNLQNKVIFLPPDYEKNTIYPIIDYYLLPSLLEGLNLSVLEAQIAHTKTIQSDTLTKETDIGLSTFIGLDPLKWATYIVSNRDITMTINKPRAESYRETNFIKTIQKVYANEKC